MSSVHRPTKSKLAELAGKKVLLVSHNFSMTGSPLLLIEIAREMRRAGLDVALTSLLDDANASRVLNLASDVVVPIRESMAFADRSDFVIANTAVTGQWVHDYLKARPGRAHRLIWWVHEIDTATFGRYVRNLDQVAALIVDSEASLRSWQNTGNPLPSVTVVIYPGVRAQLRETSDQTKFPYASLFEWAFGWYRRYNKTKIRQHLGVGEKDFLATLIGTYSPHKGHDLFADCLDHMRAETPSIPIKGLVVGFASPNAAREFTKRHRLGAESALSPNRVLPEVVDLSPYYAASDVFVINTQGQGENFGRVTTEAMAFRLPVCGTDAGGTREIVTPETGFLHPVGTPGQEQLKANLLQLINDRALARRMGEAAHQRIRDQFSDTKMFERLTDVFHLVDTG